MLFKKFEKMSDKYTSRNIKSPFSLEKSIPFRL